MSASRTAPLIGRRALAVIAGVVLLIGLSIVFGGSLDRSTNTEVQAEQVRAEVAARNQQLAASEEEKAFYVTEDFIRWQARVHGFGEKAQGETRFTLPDDAPSPAPITPIGPQQVTEPMPPFEAWMELLFGA